MGLFFTLLFVFTAYISPQELFGSLGQYHIEIIVATIALLFSVFSASGSRFLRMPQTYALIGLTIMVAVSLAFVWLGGIPDGLMEFIPNAMIFFFVIWNFKTKKQLQILILVLLVAALYTVCSGYFAELRGAGANPYVLNMRSDAGGYFYRIRGRSFLADPNDLAQFMISLIPMLFFFWSRGGLIINFLVVYVPTAILLFGMYLTHSRGGMVAMMAAVVVAGRKKIGILPSVIGGGVIFVGLTAAGFAGGREVGAGADRVEAWSMGLNLIKTHPLIGVGFKRFTEYFYITAHNTIVVCAAELGLVGLFCWMLFILPTVRDLLAVSALPKKKAEEEPAGAPIALRGPDRVAALEPARGMAFQRPALAGTGGGRMPLQAINSRTPGLPMAAEAVPGLPGTGDDESGTSVAEIRRLANLMIVSFAGFLMASWFLSRPYTMTLFMNAGIATVIFRMAREKGMPVAPLPIGRAAKLVIYTCLALLFVVYVSVRVDHLMPK